MDACKRIYERSVHVSLTALPLHHTPHPGTLTSYPSYLLLACLLLTTPVPARV